MARSIDVGDVVEIKSGFHKGDWGTVVLIDEDYGYHVAMFNDTNDCPVFSRCEIKLSSWKPSDIECSDHNHTDNEVPTENHRQQELIDVYYEEGYLDAMYDLIHNFGLEKYFE